MSSQHDYIKMYKQLKTENLKLKQMIKLQAQVIEELNRLVSELKRRLGRHDNYNTPPSQQKGSKMYSTKKKEEEEEKKKKGGGSSKTQRTKGTRWCGRLPKTAWRSEGPQGNDMQAKTYQI